MSYLNSETVAIFTPASLVLPDLNVVPQRVTKTSSSVPCDIHRGTPAARDAATIAGILADQPSLGYFKPSYATLLTDRCILLDANGEAWLVHGKPAVRTRFVATEHVKVLLSWLPPGAWPAGLS